MGKFWGIIGSCMPNHTHSQKHGQPFFTLVVVGGVAVVSGDESVDGDVGLVLNMLFTESCLS